MASPTESNLLGSEHTQYTVDSECGRHVQVTDSKIIAEKGENISGRALRLDKITMMKKRKPRTGGSMWGPLSMMGWIGMIPISILLLSIMASKGLSEPNTLLFGLGSGVFFIFFVVLPMYKSRTEDTSPPEGLVFLNIRTPEGGVGFKMFEQDIQPLIEAIDDNMAQEVAIKDET